MPPRYTPNEKDRSTVETMAAFGIPREEIARALKMTASTLRLHYTDQLESATTRVNAAVARSLYQNATERHNVVAQIFWLKCRAQWTEKAEAPATVVTPDVSVDFSRLDDSELVLLERLFRKAGSKDGKPFAMALKGQPAPDVQASTLADSDSGSGEGGGDSW